MALITLRDITLAFGGPPILDGVSLQIEEGDRLCLLGRNGTGKSTLLKLIAGSIPSEGGEIHRKQGLRVALVSQEVPRNLNGSVFEVVASGMGRTTELLAEYHRTVHEMGVGNDGGLMDKLALLQHELEAGDGWQLNQEVDRILNRLSLDADADFADLSGGTKRRTLLAQALVSAPEILLLDEPTNHLDIDTIIWLEEFLIRSSTCLVFVTHDRAFARRVANRIAELDRGSLYSFDCGYDQFVERREALLEAEVTRRALFDKKLAQEEAWIRQGIKARRTRNEGRVRALKSLREERRQRRERIGTARIQLQESERSGALVAELHEVSFSFGEIPIVRNFSTTIMRGDKIGIIGPNGSGKTTLLRLLLGELEPQSGNIALGTRREVLYFDQLREQLDLDRSVQDNVGEGNDTITVNGRQRHVIGYLQDFLFTPERARTPVRILSGGERNRLLLAKLFTKPSNILVMDEPTNDLDTETLDLLEELLMEYSGTLLLVSHDRDFLNNVVSGTIAMTGNGEVSEYVGGYDDWLRQSSEKAAAKSHETPVQGKQKPQSPRPKKLTFKEGRELEALPSRIATLEEELETLHARVSDPELYKSAGTALAGMNARMEEIEGEMETLLIRWEELECIKG